MVTRYDHAVSVHENERYSRRHSLVCRLRSSLKYRPLLHGRGFHLVDGNEPFASASSWIIFSKARSPCKESRHGCSGFRQWAIRRASSSVKTETLRDSWGPLY